MIVEVIYRLNDEVQRIAEEYIVVKSEDAAIS